MLNLIAKFDVKLLVSKQFNPMEKTSLKTSKDINKTSQPSGGHWLVRSFGFLYMFLKLLKCLMLNENVFGVYHSHVISRMNPVAYM